MENRRWVLPVVVCVGVLFCSYLSIYPKTVSSKTKKRSTQGSSSKYQRYIERVRLQGLHPQQIRRQSKAKAFFSPHDNLQKIIITLINHEQKKIQIAMYLFSDYDIAQALLAAHSRGVSIELIVDKECLEFKSNVIEGMARQGATVYVYPSLMHDKFVIFEKNKSGRPLVWTGSYNFTAQGGTTNRENAVLIDDDAVVKEYKKHFDLLKKQAKKLQEVQGTKKKKRRTKRSKQRKNAKKKRSRSRNHKGFTTTIPS